MYDYAAWLKRAMQLTEQIGKLNGLALDGGAQPPVTVDDLSRIGATCRLPIPQSLREFWTTATSGCDRTFHWTIPGAFSEQLALISEGRFHDRVWGGPEFIPLDESVLLANQATEWLGEADPEFPRDARLWGHSFPLIPVGNGDFLGLYVRDDVLDPPVAYLCHESCGGSHLISPNLSSFLEEWERIWLLGIDFVVNFCRVNDDLLSVSDFPVKWGALDALFRGRVQQGLKAPPLFSSEQEWFDCKEPNRLAKWATASGMQNIRKSRLYCCACSRRVWNDLGRTGQHAVEISEAYADGKATDIELQAARDALGGCRVAGSQSSNHQRHHQFDSK